MVVKRPDMFGFRNPGLMRIPVAQAIAGGESDGRNRTLQSLFLLIGAGERAGSGVPKIHKGWKDQHWRPPALYEREEPSDQTLLELHMINLIPAEAMDRLRDQFGTRLDGLNPDQRLILATAATEHQVTHPRIMSLCDLHPTDLSRLFALLVQDGFLEQSGRTRATVYRLPGSEPPRFQQEFGSSGLIFDDRRRPGKGSDLLSKGSEWPPESMDLNSEPLAQGRRSNAAQGDPLAELTHKEQKQLESIADLVRAHHKVAPETIKTVILALCMNRYLTIRTLARLLDRNETYLRQRILNPLVRSHLLTRAYPLAPNDPRQAYCTSKINPDDL